MQAGLTEYPSLLVVIRTYVLKPLVVFPKLRSIIDLDHCANINQRGYLLITMFLRW